MGKKISGFIGAILICLLIVLTLSVPTEADNDPILTIDSVALVQPGESTTVNLSISNLSQGLYMLQFAVEYDADKLQLTSTSIGSGFNGIGSPTLNDTVPGIIYLNWDSTSYQLTGDCTLLTMTFTAIAEEPCDAVVKISEAEECILANWETEFTPILTEGLVHIEKEWVRLRSMAANFSGRIGLNFYLVLPDYVLNDQGAYVFFTTPNGTKKQLISDGVPKTLQGELCYCYSYYIVAYEIRDNVNVKVYNGNNEPVSFKSNTGSRDYTVTGKDYSFFEYCDRMEKESTDAKMKALSTAAIDYCTAAQFYFNYNITDQLNLRLDQIGTVTLDQLEPYKPVKNGTLPDNIALGGISVLFDGDNSFRLYLNYLNDVQPNDYTYQIDLAPVSPRASGGKYYVGFDNVASNKLDKLHEFTISDNDNSFFVSYSVLTYARAIVKNSSDENAKNLGKALYLYSLAANEYFPN